MASSDSGALPSLPKTDLEAEQLEYEHVHRVYVNIAHSFSDSRYRAWPDVSRYLHSFPTGSIIFDVGCGNGKYFHVRSDLILISCDRSENLLNICRSRHCEVFLADCLHIPLQSNTVDGILCIAVIHHLSTESRRLIAIREIVRVLTVNGQALITVWAKEQQRENEKSIYISKHVKLSEAPTNRCEQKDQLIIHQPRTEFQRSDCLVPWAKPTEKHLRYYHVFVGHDLEQLFQHIREIELVQSYYDDGNWCVIIKKIQ